MGKPAKCISVSEARNLQDKWVATREPALTSSLGEQDCREVLFSVSDLEEFLTYVKEESKKQGITNPGIRIYFGAYDTHTSNKATVFLSPTKNVSDSSTENNYSIDSFNTGTSGNPPTAY